MIITKYGQFEFMYKGRVGIYNKSIYQKKPAEMFAKIVIFCKKNLFNRIEEPTSSLGYEYPKFRDHPLHPPELWIESKRLVEGAEGLWRIEDDLYDFSCFVYDHPGGRDWLELTKGTDITEAFEIHHLSNTPRNLLKEYFVRKAKTPRNSPFTFEQNGFYQTLKRHVKKELEYIPRRPEIKSQIFADILLLTTLLLSLAAVKFESYSSTILSGVALTLTSIAAHNFFHQKDSFRMYYFDFTLMSSRNWRITHVLSHHIFTNTIYDWEISSLEPFLQYLPIKKNYFVKYISWFYSPVVYIFVYLGYYIRTIVYAFNKRKPLLWTTYIPVAHFLFLYMFGGKSITLTLIYYLAIINLSSFLFSVIGVNAAHHHPDLFHDGDEPMSYPKIDWGIHQLDAVMDRKETISSPFFGLVSFGDHALHHLFPTIDHGRLQYLYPIFEVVCKQFGLKIKVESNLNLTKGQFMQLANDVPRKLNKSE